MEAEKWDADKGAKRYTPPIEKFEPELSRHSVSCNRKIQVSKTKSFTLHYENIRLLSLHLFVNSVSGWFFQLMNR